MDLALAPGSSDPDLAAGVCPAGVHVSVSAVKYIRVMALKPKEEIGMEVHQLDQFFRVEEGAGEAVLDGTRTAISAGFAVLVPAGTNHNIINTGSAPLKIYTLYSPPNHRDGVVHHTRAEAEKDNEHFDGKTTG